MHERAHREEDRVLVRHARLLLAAAESAELLVRGRDWRASVDGVLALVGEAAGSSRAYVFERAGELLYQRAEWTAEGIEPLIDADHLQGFPPFDSWSAAFAQGSEIRAVTAELPPVERELLQRDGIRSILVVPVPLEQTWWGYIGFDDCVGERRWEDAEVRTLRGVASTLGAVIERGRAEAVVHEATQRYRALVDDLDAVVWEAEDERVTFVSRRVEDVFGYSVEEWLAAGRTWERALHPDDREAALAASARALAEGGFHRVAYRLVTRGGRVLWLEDILNVEIDPDGGPTRTRGITVDVTAAREAEQQLRQAEERSRAIFTGSPIPTWVYDRETLAFLTVNEAAVATYGYTQEEFASMTIADIRPAEDVPVLRKLVDDLDDGRTRRHTWRHLRKDGTLIDVDIFSSEIPFDGRRARMVVAYDVTEQLRLEAQLRQAQKMEALGRLAGGIAHDFNNVVTAIGGHADLALRQLDGHPALTEVEAIRFAADRAAALTRGLLAFSRRQVLQRTRLDLNAVVREMEPLLRRTLGDDVVVETVLEAALWPVIADRTQVEQVIMNLAVNARDAMPDGGRLWLRTDNMTVAASAPGAVDEDYACLTVTDNGTGMSEDVRARAFEPFFTTRGPGEGTGLGLSTVYGIAEQSGGHVEIESRPGSGTTVRVAFPHAGGGTEEKESPTRPPAGAAAGGTETVLLVEDDALVRTLARKVLERAGYTVVDAYCAEAALAAAAEHAGPIDVLVTDVVMPGLAGPELAELLWKERPGLPVLFMSGYTDHPRVTTLSGEGARFLQKPFPPDELVAAVRALLDAAAAEEPHGSHSRPRCGREDSNLQEPKPSGT